MITPAGPTASRAPAPRARAGRGIGSSATCPAPLSSRSLDAVSTASASTASWATRPALASMKRSSSAGSSAETQRAAVYGAGIMRASTPYSCSSRCATTSNCSWPTAPSSSTEPRDRAEHLDRAFLAELRQAGAQLLGAQRVGDLDRAEHLGREERQPGELQRLAFGERVAELQHAVVGDADDVAGVGLVEQLAALRQEATPPCSAGAPCRCARPSAACRARSGPRHTRTNAIAVAVRRVHVGLDLEDHAGELRLVGLRPCAASRPRSPAAARGRPARRAPRARRSC